MDELQRIRQMGELQQKRLTVVAGSRRQAVAEALIEALLSPRGQAVVLARHGFQPPPLGLR